MFYEQLTHELARERDSQLLNEHHTLCRLSLYFYPSSGQATSVPGTFPWLGPAPSPSQGIVPGNKVAGQSDFS